MKRYKDSSEMTMHPRQDSSRLTPKKGSYLFLKQQIGQLKRDMSNESLHGGSKYALHDQMLRSEDAHRIPPSLEKLNISKDYFN